MQNQTWHKSQTKYTEFVLTFVFVASALKSHECLYLGSVLIHIQDPLQK